MALRKQLTVCLENKVGELARVCLALKKANINLLATCVADSTDSCLLRLVPDKVAQAKETLKKLGLAILPREVVAVSLPNKPGALGEVSAKLSKEKINIDYAYGSTSGGCKEAMCILAVSDARKASQLLK
jgi:hypothetical protein